VKRPSHVATGRGGVKNGDQARRNVAERGGPCLPKKELASHPSRGEISGTYALEAGEELILLLNSEWFEHDPANAPGPGTLLPRSRKGVHRRAPI